MNILKEQLHRAKELMGLLSEAGGGNYRWFATEEQYKDHERSNKEQSVVLKMDLIKGDSMTDSKKVERISWEGTEGTRTRGMGELEGKAEQINRKYKIDIEIPKDYHIRMKGEKKEPESIPKLDETVNEQILRMKEIDGILSEQKGPVTDLKVNDVFEADVNSGGNRPGFVKGKILSDESSTGTFEVSIIEVYQAPSTLLKTTYIMRLVDHAPSVDAIISNSRTGETFELEGVTKQTKETDVVESDNDIFNGDDAGDGQYRSDRDRHRRNPYSAKTRFRAGLGKSL